MTACSVELVMGIDCTTRVQQESRIPGKDYAELNFDSAHNSDCRITIRDSQLVLFYHQIGTYLKQRGLP